MKTEQANQDIHAFTADARAAIYQVIFSRRDVRGQFLPKAVQNLWLAARAEGLGVGWVSIFNQAALQAALGIPKGITPIACLCVGYVSHFFAKPELEAIGWLPRLPIEDLVYFDQWGRSDDGQPLVKQIKPSRRRPLTLLRASRPSGRSRRPAARAKAQTGPATTAYGCPCSSATIAYFRLLK
ncbi:MAG: nitroreductase family protein [Gammaproteobacteria bacterium]